MPKRQTRRSAWADGVTPMKEASVTVSFGDSETAESVKEEETVAITTMEATESTTETDITENGDSADNEVKEEPTQIESDSSKSISPSKGKDVTAVQVTKTTDTEENGEKEPEVESMDTEMEDTTTSTNVELDPKAEVSETPEPVKTEGDHKEAMEEEVAEEDGQDAGDEGFQEDPYPEAFEKLSQLTVNIGPVKLDDLVSPDLHKLLDTCLSFDVKFEAKILDGPGKFHPKNRLDKLGYVRIPFEFKHPIRLVNITNKLSDLKIGGRDMSVKFPQQFLDAMKHVKDYVERMKKEKSQYIADLFKRRLLVKNFPKGVTVKKLQEVFPEACRHVIKKFREGRNFKPCVVRLHFETPEAAEEYYDQKKEVKMDDQTLIITYPYKDTRKKTEKKASTSPAVVNESPKTFTSPNRNRQQKRGRGQFNTRDIVTGNTGRNQQASRQQQQQQQQMQRVQIQQQMLAQQSSNLANFGTYGGGSVNQGQGYVNQNQSSSSYGGGMGGQSMGGGYRGGQSSMQREEDPLAMMASLKSTLAMMEQNMMQVGGMSGGAMGGASMGGGAMGGGSMGGGSMGGGGMGGGGGRKGGKRKGGSDYRNDNKRQYGGGSNYSQNYGGSNW